jgi:hypothetical protein
VKVLSYFPVTLTIDGAAVAIRVKRMTHDEWFLYDHERQKAETPTLLRFVSRQPSEQQKDAEGAYRIPFTEIIERRLQDMTPETREAYEAAVEADEEQARGFVVLVFERFVTVAGGLTEEGDDGVERSVTTGLDLLRIFGARADVLRQVLQAVQRENSLDADQKKAWSSPPASSPGSTAPKPGPRGRRRATTAGRAATKGSAGTGAATPQPQGPSGSTATSSPPGAPSVN